MPEMTNSLSLLWRLPARQTATSRMNEKWLTLYQVPVSRSVEPSPFHVVGNLPTLGSFRSQACHRSKQRQWRGLINLLSDSWQLGEWLEAKESPDVDFLYDFRTWLLPINHVCYPFPGSSRPSFIAGRNSGWLAVNRICTPNNEPALCNMMHHYTVIYGVSRCVILTTMLIKNHFQFYIGPIECPAVKKTETLLINMNHSFVDVQHHDIHKFKLGQPFLFG